MSHAFCHAVRLVLLALFAMSFGTARADSDQMLAMSKYLGSHGYGRVVVDTEGANREIFPCEVNDHTLYLQVDTGCGRTCITHESAQALKLDVQLTHHENWGAGGKINGDEGLAPITSFKLGKYEINRTSSIEILPPQARLSRIDGLFGFDFLKLNAVILPVGARVFLYKPGATPMADIAPYMQAMSFHSVPLHYMRGGLYVDGMLNGQPCTALIDCGAEYSTFDLDYVLKVQGGQVASESLTMVGVDGAKELAHLFVPKHLQLGSLTLDQKDLTATKTPSFQHEGFNAIFGYDLLAEHQAIMDLGHETLWLK